jgi:hypothetical protein
MLTVLPKKVLIDIDAAIDAAAKEKLLLRVYAVAEVIRRKHASENIALEDIAEAVMSRSAKGTAFEVDISDAASAVLATTTL